MNAVGPGAVVTPINKRVDRQSQSSRRSGKPHPHGTAGCAEEIASVFAFLASDDASYITGQTIYACGGADLYPEFRWPGLPVNKEEYERSYSKVVLITGAKGGLGLLLPVLSGCGCNFGCLRASRIPIFPSQFRAMPADLTIADAARQLADGCTCSRFQKIDVLVHVMGGFAGGQPIPETDDGTWDRMMNLNLRSAFNILRAVFPPCARPDAAASSPSAAAPRSKPPPTSAPTTPLKRDWSALVRTAALENKDLGITANVILPGTMNTEANRKADPAPTSPGGCSRNE